MELRIMIYIKLSFKIKEMFCFLFNVNYYALFYLLLPFEVNYFWQLNEILKYDIDFYLNRQARRLSYIVESRDCFVASLLAMTEKMDSRVRGNDRGESV